MFPPNNNQPPITGLNQENIYALAVQQNILQLLNQQNASSARMSTPNYLASLLTQNLLQSQQPTQQQAQPRASLSQQYNFSQLHPSQSISAHQNFAQTLTQSLMGQQTRAQNIDEMRRRPSLLSGGSSGHGSESSHVGGLSIDTRPTLNTNSDVRHSPMHPAIIDEELDRQKREINEKIDKVEKEKKQAEIIAQNLARRREALQKLIAEKKESTFEENEESGDESHETSFIDRIYAENKRRVANTHNSNPLLKNIKGHNPLPLYQEPSDLPELKKIRDDYVNRMAPFLIKRMREKRENHRVLIEDQHRKYVEQYSSWQKKVEKWEKNPKKTAKDAKNREIYEKLFPEIKKSREEKERSIRSDRSRISMGGNLSTEKDEQREEDKYKNAAVIPPIACVGPPRHAFDNNNGLVTKVMEEHKNRLEKFLSNWTDEEKKIFEDNIANYGKNFAAIALFLKSRNVKDCVWYYYMSKKRNNYKAKFARRKKKIGKQYKPPVMPQLGDIFPDVLQQGNVSKSSRVLACLLCDAKIETYILPPQILTRAACDMYGYDVNDPNGVNELPVCQKCSQKAQKDKTANRCPIGTCPGGRRKIKPVRAIPEKLNNLPPEHRRFIVNRIKVPPSASKCCNNCWKKITKDIESLQEGELNKELEEFIRKTAEKTAQYEDVIEWADEEITQLRLAIGTHGTENWNLIAESLNMTRISAQHCQKQFEKMTAEGVWAIDVKEEVKENLEMPMEVTDTLTISQIKEIKVEIPEVNSPELGPGSGWTGEAVKIEDKDDDIMIVEEVRHERKESLLRVHKETNEESSPSKNFGSITQGTPLMRSSQIVPPLTANPLKAAFQPLPSEQAGFQESQPASDADQTLMRTLLTSLLIGGSQEADPLETLARQIALNMYGVEPTREIIDGLKYKLAAHLQQQLNPQQASQVPQNPLIQQHQQQQQQQLSYLQQQQQLANLPGSSALRRDQPAGQSAAEQIKKDILTASQMMEERKNTSEAMLKFRAEMQNQQKLIGFGQRPGLLPSSTHPDSVIMKTTPEKTIDQRFSLDQSKGLRKEITIIEAHQQQQQQTQSQQSAYRSAFSNPNMAQTLRPCQQGSSFSSLHQPYLTQQQPNLARTMPVQQQAPIIKIEDRKSQIQPPSTSATLRVPEEQPKTDPSPVRTRKSGISTVVLPSPVAPVSTSQSPSMRITTGAYPQKRTMSPSITNLRNTPPMQQRARTPFDAVSLTGMTVTTTQPQQAAQQHTTQIFGIAPRSVTPQPQTKVDLHATALGLAQRSITPQPLPKQSVEPPSRPLLQMSQPQPIKVEFLPNQQVPERKQALVEPPNIAASMGLASLPTVMSISASSTPTKTSINQHVTSIIPSIQVPAPSETRFTVHIPPRSDSMPAKSLASTPLKSEPFVPARMETISPAPVPSKPPTPIKPVTEAISPPPPTVTTESLRSPKQQEPEPQKATAPNVQIQPQPITVLKEEPPKSTVESTQPSATIATTAPITLSILGPWASEDMTSLNLGMRTTFSPNMTIGATSKEEAVPASAPAPMSIATSLQSMIITEDKKEPETSAKATITPAASVTSLISPTPTVSNQMFEDLSSSEDEAVHDDKKSLKPAYSITPPPVVAEDNEPSSTPGGTLMFSLLALTNEEAITLSDAVTGHTPPIRTPESTRSDSVKVTPQSSNTTFVQPTYEPLSDDDD